MEQGNTAVKEAALQEVIDFKMVTFSLGGKDYGIDIMRVKEIAKFTHFTYVPNTAHYVRGVYNLRGEIISIIDLRQLFNLPVEERAEHEPENGLILRLEQNMIGVVVDSIDKVVGISSSHIQPPHPIFGDINIKYINGVAEYDDRLYLILDIDRIFRRPEDTEEHDIAIRQQISSSVNVTSSVEAMKTAGPGENVSAPAAVQEDVGKINRRFIADGLAAFSAFYVSPVNDEWFTLRAEQWISDRKGAGLDFQLKELKDAESFLASFYSRYSGTFWASDYHTAFLEQVPSTEGSVYNVWNPGCGGGRESYSLAIGLHRKYPNRQIKIWAGDKDLLKISNAPNLLFSWDEIPSEWSDFVLEGKNGLTFTSEIKDSILFEFSDVLSAATMPAMDLIVARDLVSFQKLEEQQRILERFEETLKPGGALLLGDNESGISGEMWKPISGIPMNMHIHV